MLYAALAVLAFSLLAIAASLIVGMNDRWAVAEGWWPFVYGIALWGMPAGFALLAVALVLGQRRRRNELKAARPPV